MGDQKLALDVESAVRWVYQREMLRHDGLFGLPLPHIKAPGWTKMIDTGVPVDESHDHELRGPVADGAPHPDALLIDFAVRSLPAVRVDWRRDRTHLMGELAPYIAEDDPIAGHMATSPTVNLHEHRSRSGRALMSARVDRTTPLVQPYELTPAAYLMLHARLGTRPVWEVGPIRMVRRKGGFIGRQKAKNSYTEGSRNELTLDPAPQEIAAARFEYMVWHCALVALVGVTSRLQSIALQYPKAPAAPWSGETEDVTMRQVRRAPRTAPTNTRLPLKPTRDRALPPLMSEIEELTLRRRAPVRYPLTTPEDVA